MRNYGKLAYEAYMNAKGHYSMDDDWKEFGEIGPEDRHAWDEAAQVVSDATRGWIQTKISGPIE